MGTGGFNLWGRQDKERGDLVFPVMLRGEQAGSIAVKAFIFDFLFNPKITGSFLIFLYIKLSLDFAVTGDFRRMIYWLAVITLTLSAKVIF